MANIKLQNGWNQPEIYQNVAYVTFETDTEGVMATYYEGGPGTGGIGVQANWAQNDAQSPDHIKNRPFYSEYESIISSEVKFVSDDTTLYTAELTGYTAPNAHEYLITWGRELWLCDVEVEEGKKYFGNRNLDTEEPQSNDPPFAGEWNNDILKLYTTQEGTIGFGLSVEGKIHQIAEKYLPEEVKQVPKPTEDDKGKILTVSGEGIPSWGPGLPSIDPNADEGRLLGVFEGNWAIVDAPEGGSTKKELPDIYPGDNGKLLGVKGDVWTKVDAEKELPRIESEDDEGKVLGVVEGKWAMVDAVKTAKIDIFPPLTVGGFAANEDFGNAYFAPSPSNFTLVEGEIYYVEWDDATFPCECKSGTFGGMDILYLGNDRLLGGESDEPFTVGYYIDYGTAGFITNDNNKTSHNIYIYQLDRLDQADWNQNDKTQASYIKNRPFGETEQRQTLFEDGTEFTLTYNSTEKCYQQIITNIDAQKSQLWEGEWDTAYVTINSQPYSCPYVIDGDMKMIGSALNPDSEDKFVFVISGAIAIFLYYIDFVEDILTLPVSIKLGVTTVKKIDSKYLPDNFGVPESTASDVGKVLTVVAEGIAAWEARGLPNVDTAEDGAFLRIVSGEPAWVTIPSGEEAKF